MAQESSSPRWAIALHGGAGSIPRSLSAERVAAYEASLRGALRMGIEILEAGGKSVDAVQAVVVALENDPTFNAGRGAVFTRAGTHELDASIMEGESLRAGAVGGVKQVRNPILAARAVMEQTPHVLLIGDAAEQFAFTQGCERVDPSYFFNLKRFRALQQTLKEKQLPMLERPAYALPADVLLSDPLPEDAGGTVGCVALDLHGNLAAATSTGGLTGKMPGRVGDSPIIGAGTYANNRSCAVSGTGVGEQFIRYSVGARIALLMELKQMTVQDAVKEVLTNVLLPDDGGVIAVDARGAVTLQSNTGAMPRAAADSSGLHEVAIWFDE